jgi:hypothetical protein
VCKNLESESPVLHTCSAFIAEQILTGSTFTIMPRSVFKGALQRHAIL